MSTATLELIVRLKDEASSALSGMASQIDGVGRAAAGLAAGGLLAVGGGLAAAATAGLGLNSAMEQATAKINAFTKDGDATAAILQTIREEAAKTPFEFNEMARAAAGLLPVVNATGQPLDGLIKQAEILAASNPTEGLEGAVYALKQAAGGDFASVIDRFDLNRQTLNRLKEQGVPALDAVTQAMQEMGYDADLVTNLAGTMSGRWSTFTDSLQTVAGAATQPIFDRLSQGLADMQPTLDALMPQLTTIAMALGETLVAAMEGAIGAMQFLAQHGDIVVPVLVGLGAALAVAVVPAIWSMVTASAALVAANAPWLAILAAIAVAVGALYYAWETNFLGIRDTVATVWSTIQPWLAAAADWVGTKLAEAGAALQTAWTTVWPLIQAAVDTVYHFLADTVWPWLSSGFAWLKDTALTGLQTAWETVWPIVQSAVSTVYGFLKETVWPWFQTAFAWVTDTGLPAVQSAFNTVWPIIQSAVSTVYGFFKDTVWPFLQTAFNDAATWIESMKDRWDTAIAAAKLIVAGLQTKVEEVKAGIDVAVGVIKGLFTTGWDTVKSTVEGVWNSIGSSISGPIETAKGLVNTAISTIKGWIQEGIDKVNALIGAINSIPGIPNMPDVPQFATGVRNFSGGLALVGERGPELVTLPRGADVYSAAESRQMVGAGQAVSITIDARGASDPRAVEDAGYRGARRALQEAGISLDTLRRTRGSR